MDTSALDPSGCLELADPLPETPVNAIPIGALRRGIARAYAAPGARLVVVFGEGTGYGDVRALHGLLQTVEDCTCVLLPTDDANALADLITAPVRFVDDVQYVLHTSPTPRTGPDVRIIDASTLPERARIELFGEIPLEAIAGCVVACAFEDGVPVAQAGSLFRSATYADIGVRTIEAYRGQGFATAAAGMVAASLWDQGLRPVWSTSTENRASRRVAEKLGFDYFSSQRFVVPEGGDWT